MLCVEPIDTCDGCSPKVPYKNSYVEGYDLYCNRPDLPFPNTLATTLRKESTDQARTISPTFIPTRSQALSFGALYKVFIFEFGFWLLETDTEPALELLSAVLQNRLSKHISLLVQCCQKHLNTQDKKKTVVGAEKIS
jgi:hypothetical protein